MDKRWDLTVLYEDFNDVFLNDVEKLNELVNDFILFGDSDFNNEIEVMTKYCQKLETILQLYRRVGSFVHLTRSTDTLNENANKYGDVLGQIMSSLTKPEVKFQMWLKDVLDLESKIESNDFLRKYKFILLEIQDQASHLLSEKEEVLYSKLRMTSSSSWSRLQSQITSSLMIDFELDGKVEKLPLSAIRNLAYHKDSDVRKRAYEAELAAYKSIEDTVALSISNIKREVNIMTELRGFESPLAETLSNSRMSKATLDAMLSAMEEYLPILRQYLKKKAEYLGLEGPLPFYDLFAPVGSLDKTFTYEEGSQLVVDNFRSFSDKLADFAKNAIDSRWIDVEPRSGKVGGAFCSNLPMIKQSRFLLNYTGTFSNVTTLAHELGHGYHGQIICEEAPLNWSYPMPLAETASILCETIVTENLLNTLSESEQLTVLEASLMSDTQVIVDIMSRYLFETAVFLETKEVTLSSKKLKDLMINAQQQTYGDGLDNNYLHPYMWINKSHYYSAGLSFYNFPYAFGSLFGKGLYAQYLEDKPSFVKKYDEMLSHTGKNTVEEVASIMGIDVTSKDFWCSSLEIIKNDIEKFTKLVDKLK